MSKFLTVLIALCITISGTGCSFNNSANIPAQVSEAPPVEDDCEQRADKPGSIRDSKINEEEVQVMKIRVRIGEKDAIAVLDDSPTARDFISLLPLTLTMTDYNGTEKIADLPRKLDLEGAPEGFDPTEGDICIYAPWGNLAIFYKDFAYSQGLVPLAHIDSGTGILAEKSGEFEVTIETIN